MNSEISTIVDQMMGASNEQRAVAEQTIKTNRSGNAEAFLTQIVQFIKESTDMTKLSFVILLLKKLYLDERPEEQEQWQIPADQVAGLKD